jgi:hypothetical protein
MWYIYYCKLRMWQILVIIGLLESKINIIHKMKSNESKVQK